MLFTSLGFAFAEILPRVSWSSLYPAGRLQHLQAMTDTAAACKRLCYHALVGSESGW
jgi:hypothetical protein